MSKESTILKQQAEIKSLRKQVDELKGEVAEWQRLAQIAMTGADQDVMLRVFNPWGLTRKELGVLFAILRRPNGATRDQIMLALYTGESIDSQPEIKVIDVFVCKVRRKLAEVADSQYALPRSAIETVWGTGYKIAPEHHAKLTSIMGYDPSSITLDANGRAA